MSARERQVRLTPACLRAIRAGLKSQMRSVAAIDRGVPPDPVGAAPLGSPGDRLDAGDGILLRIAGVRVERLQEIRDSDLACEGGMWRETTPLGVAETDRAGFARWWDEVHARPDAKWAGNPWVWVIEFEREPTMYLIRDVFRCKPGHAKVVAEMLKRTIPSMESSDGFRNCRVMVDMVSIYWTVVLEAEVDTLAAFEGHMASFSARPDVQEALKGYLDLLDGGHREIYRIV